MSRISEAFARLRDRNEAALIPYITAGDPSLTITEELVPVLEKAGADLIELGMPFSDPMADGPTIQKASERALAQGVTLRKVLNLVSRLRRKTDIPIILMGYYNPFLAYGIKKLADDARKAGVDGLLVDDLPPEEAQEIKEQSDRVGMDLIFLLAPTSDESRIRLIKEKASGFLYYVSVTGVTGARSTLDKAIKGQVEKIRGISGLPIGVGFGISCPEHVARVSRWADAVIVGSALINVVVRHQSRKHLLREVGRFVSSLKEATKRRR
jgi:tryptophan synthase alpha chain